jgi:hypothetical protein
MKQQIYIEEDELVDDAAGASYLIVCAYVYTLRCRTRRACRGWRR